MKIIPLETERLVLRQWRESDRDAFADLNANAQVREFFLKTLSRAESDLMFDDYVGFIRQYGWGMWAVEEKTTANFIGVVGLFIPKVELPISPCIEIAWRLAVPFWGKGYATEAALGVLRHGFETLQLEEIVAITTLQNKRSQLVMEKLGMQRAAHHFMHPSVPEGHPLQVHCLYKILKSDWQLQQRK